MSSPKKRKDEGKMYCVVVSEFLSGHYLLRHIIYDIPPDENITSVKRKYYKDYCKTDTDTFYLCQNQQEVEDLLKKVEK